MHNKIVWTGCLCLSLLSSGCHLPSREKPSREAERVEDWANGETEVGSLGIESTTQSVDLERVQTTPYSVSTEAQSANETTLLAGSQQRLVDIVVSGVSQGAGPVRIAVFSNADDFPKHEMATQKFTVDSSASQVQSQLLELPDGAFAVAVYQDLNNDGTLNCGSFGIPTEPYGFSNNAKGAMGPPSFQAAMLKADAGNIEVQLSKLSF